MKAKQLADLTRDPENRRRHTPRNLEMVTDAFRQVGAARSIVIDEDDRILAGNASVEGAIAAGLTRLQIVEVDGQTVVAVRRRGLTEAQKRDLAIFDNRAAELSEWDLTQLEKDQAAGLSFSPFWTPDERRAMFAHFRAGETDPEAVPAPRATTIKRGDLFQLGAHRLACGDSESAADLARLFEDARADALFSSPPYNVGVKYGQHDDATKSRGDYFGWLGAVVRGWAARMHRGRALIWNVGVSPDTAAHRHVVMLEALDLTFVRQFVWQKVGVPVPTFHATRANPLVRRLTSNYTHEMMYVMGTGPLEVGPARALADFTLEHDVFWVHQAQSTIDLPTTNEGRTGKQSNLDRRSRKAHPAPFPVTLVTAFLQHYVAPGELVAEPFAGSGSTLIGCEQLEARCYGMEIDPVYCQVAIDRWEAFSGSKAQQIGAASSRRRKEPHARPQAQALKRPRARR